jgi:hypothetical protein
MQDSRMHSPQELVLRSTGKNDCSWIYSAIRNLPETVVLALTVRTGLMPVVAHGLGGIDCAGCIVAVVEGATVELHCNVCGGVVGVVLVYSEACSARQRGRGGRSRRGQR